MDDFPGLLARDFGFKPQGKAAPMAAPGNSPAGSFSSFPSSNFGLGSDFVRSSSSAQNKVNTVPIFYDHDGAAAEDGLIFNDLFGGRPKYASSESLTPAPPAFDYDDLFGDQKISKSSSMPAYDKPVYDEDIFEGMPGLKSSPAAPSTKYDDVFASISPSPRKQKKQDSSPFDDLLGDLGRKTAEGKRVDRESDEKKDIHDFDDLIPGFGRSCSPPSKRPMPELNKSQKSYCDSPRVASSGMEDPFVVLKSASVPTVYSSGVSTDLLEEVGKHGNSRSRKTEQSAVPDALFDDLGAFDDLVNSMPDISKRGEDTIPIRTGSMNGIQSPVENSQSQWQRKDPDDFQGSHQSPFDLPSGSIGRSASPLDVNNVENSRADTTSRSGFDSSNDVWLTVSEIPLLTQPTSAPPPSRPPPPRPTRPNRSDSSSFSSRNPTKKNNVPSSFESPYSLGSADPSARSSVTSQIDELEDFATGRARSEANEYPAEFVGQDLEANSAAAAAAMKEAMEKAEAKFRHAREMREREYLKSFRSKESVQLETDDYQEKERGDEQERLDNERQHRLREDEEKELRRLEKERARAQELEREREEREREQRRLEKERIGRERELGRQAVERATREARERAAAEARSKAQKAAVEKAAAEARERAERSAVQRAQAEARERAAVEAREKAVKAAAEARERANAEARERDARARAERTAVERAAAEARERAAAEARERAAAGARERAAAQARANQQKNDNDFESFFSSRPSSAPGPKTNASDPAFDTQNHRGPPGTSRASAGASTSMRKASSTTNIVDDLSSIFGAAASPSGVFQEVDGETEERRRARLERHQRTQERAAKAVAEKNERDLQAQREQAERYRIGETLDVEIKRWAAGKEGNLRAMLSTLQYVLWSECGWQPVSLTDLIMAASVKKVYRKATLCIHPDKVQQKGATLQQKYVAEKVFDLLKEAWNKFNSEELF